MRGPSIYRRLLLTLLLLFALSIAFASMLAVHSAHHNIDNDYDSQLISESHTILMFVHEDLEESGKLDSYKLDPEVLSFLPSEISALHEYGRWRALRIWKDGKIVAQSDVARTLPFPMSRPGFSDQVHDGAKWRIYAVEMPAQHIMVETMENLHNRERLIGGIIEEMAEPSFVILPLLLVLLAFSIRFGLSGIRVLTAQIERRAPEDLSPLMVRNLPRELSPLQRALDSLLHRLEVSLRSEREFSDNAAHELRTPLAAMRLQGQLVAHARDGQERDEAIQTLLEGIDRTTDLFNQLLTLSRMQHHSAALQNENLALLVRSAVSGRVPLAAAKNIEITLDGDESFGLVTNPEIFTVLLGVLLDNAIKYTPQDGRIAIEFTPQALSVTDTGPGIPDADKERVFERFYRVRGNTAQGSGLGLSIARQACEFLRMGIRLEDGPEGRGLRVVLLFKNEDAQRA